ncbi:sulfite exporter TauE/SafE family protein [Gemmatimonas sp.]|uniref:sulfite exporter TauE/SafE family protein n=1 Tax=Gemmatimonas sp. TaxID=1962908 RepID=UPI00356378B6
MIGTASGILVASLLGSIHCAGMCGGFVCFYTDAGSGTDAAALRAHAMYNVGRLTSYLTLGAIAGAIGVGVSALGALAGVQHAAAVVAGALMIGWAISTMAAQRGLRLGALRHSALRVPEAWQRAMGRVLHAVREQPIATRAWLTGLLTTMLPCGWLYVFVATAGGSGSIRAGVLTMAVFWLGTVPALLAVGLGVQRVFGPLRHRLPMLSAALVLMMGLLSISGRFSMHRAASETLRSDAPSVHAAGSPHRAMP